MALLINNFNHSAKQKGYFKDNLLKKGSQEQKFQSIENNFEDTFFCCAEFDAPDQNITTEGLSFRNKTLAARYSMLRSIIFHLDLPPPDLS
jgi:hypothetical protein